MRFGKVQKLSKDKDADEVWIDEAKSASPIHLIVSGVGNQIHKRLGHEVESNEGLYRDEVQIDDDEVYLGSSTHLITLGKYMTHLP